MSTPLSAERLPGRVAHESFRESRGSRVIECGTGAFVARVIPKRRVDEEGSAGIGIRCFGTATPFAVITVGRALIARVGLIYRQ